MPEADTEVVFTIEVKPDTVEVDGYIGRDADKAEAFALCERLFGAVRDFGSKAAVVSPTVHTT